MHFLRIVNDKKRKIELKKKNMVFIFFKHPTSLKRVLDTILLKFYFGLRANSKQDRGWYVFKTRGS